MHPSARAQARFQPYAMAVQTRFKWRHKETDRWRRLMDATCFPVDWISQTRGPNFSQYSGHWTHILTCAHVICPWDYPNYYSPDGPARFVSRITLADTMTQVRLVSLQGNSVHKHFTSNQHVYVHSNPRLDLCVVHPEQNFKRSGEMKMMWMQNEGYIIRPRLELLRSLMVGDHVWVYGMTAYENLFDEEKAPEPLMVPTGVRARVHAKTREHFFLDTSSLETQCRGPTSDPQDAGNNIQMGMCGSVVIRDGKCVGMLTATVHADSPNRDLAGTAMCTYAEDIFEFLLEVEKQMKRPVPRINAEETRFESRRRAETGDSDPAPAEKDWDLDHSRMARHIPVPSSLWHMEEKWMTEEDFMTSAVFGRSGVFNQETQESSLGYDMASSKTHGERPADARFAAAGGHKPPMQGERKDHSPTGIYAAHEDFKSKDVWNYEASSELRSLFDSAVPDGEAHQLQRIRQSLENIKAQRAMERMKETCMKTHAEHEAADFGKYGHYGGSASAGASNFNYETDADVGGAPEDRYRRQDDSRASTAAARESDHMGAPISAPRDPPPSAKKGVRRGTTDAREKRREEERKHQQELRLRHGNKATPFTDPDLTSMWDQH